jgi:hypothetical protein
MPARATGYTEDYAEDYPKEISPLSPPRGAEPEGKEKAGSERSPSDTSSFGGQPDPAQNRAGEGRDRKRSPRKRDRSRGGTSEAGLEALRTHKNKRFGHNDLKPYVDVAECFDFASEDAPPWQVLKWLDNDFKLFGRIRKIVQAAEREAEVDALNAKKQRGHPKGKKKWTMLN